ncbi:hypothetical protein [Pseudomonas sp. NPDC089734]|uniref:hypothetical protein n=1 Tax=Pseudomonas sp. NPDC089734 TaxID=3364469 RepID=UPI0037FE22B1
MFKLHEVWKSIDEHKMVVYFCFEDLTTKKFGVQSLEGFGLSDSGDRNSDARKQAIELFIEESPLERCLWGDTLEDAIAKFDDFMSK